MRRLAASGDRNDLLACVTLLKRAPEPRDKKRLMAGFEAGLAGRALPDLPEELAEAMSRFGGGSVLLGVRRGEPKAVEQSIALLEDERADRTAQLQLIEVFGQVSRPSCVPVLLKLVCSARDPALRGAALGALARYDSPVIAVQVVRVLASMTDDVRADAFGLLASRPSWARTLLEAVEAGKVDARSVPPEAVQRIRLHRDPALAVLARKVWGEPQPGTPALLQAEIDRLDAAVRAGSGVPKPGKVLFTQRCARCHTLFGSGAKVGPDLTAYRRDDLATMLLSIVNPSAEIREGFASYLAAAADGRTLTGTLVDQDPQRVVLRGADGRDVTIRRDEIEDMKAVPTSLMPEGLLKDLNDQQVRDLFAYLRSTQPLID
jgi:putative heme-binding domain-containing protein